MSSRRFLLTLAGASLTRPDLGHGPGQVWAGNWHCKEVSISVLVLVCRYQVRASCLASGNKSLGVHLAAVDLVKPLPGAVQEVRKECVEG